MIPELGGWDPNGAHFQEIQRLKKFFLDSEETHMLLPYTKPSKEKKQIIALPELPKEAVSYERVKSVVAQL